MESNNKYNTKQKELILVCLKDNKQRHLTVDDIMEYLKAEGAIVGQTTVYRNLDKFVKDGIAQKYNAAERMGACYQYVEKTGSCINHYHLVCIDCGEMIHLECNYLDDVSSHISDKHKFKLDKFKTVLYGHCNNCDYTNKIDC